MADSEWQADIAGIQVKSKDIVDLNMLRVSAGTTSPAGGDAGHGGRTFISVEDTGSTSWGARITSRSGRSYTIGSHLDPDLKSVEILLGGDAEAKTIVEALRFAADTIEQSLGVSKTGRS